MIDSQGEVLKTTAAQLDYLFSCYFTANYDQTVYNTDKIKSFARDLSMSENEPMRLRELVHSSIEYLFSEVYGSANIDVISSIIDDGVSEFYGIKLAVKVKDFNDEVVDLKTSFNKISKVITDVNLAKQHITIGDRL